MEEKHREELESQEMQYEDLRVLCLNHYDLIQKIVGERDKLIADLDEMTRKKEYLDGQLRQKERDYDELFDKFEKKSMEFINERHAHRLQIEENQRLEEEIKDLKRQIADHL